MRLERNIPCLLTLALLPFAAPMAASAEVVDIGHTPQFFLDDHLVDNRWSLKPKREEVLRVFHPPVKHEGNPVLAGEGGYVTVVRDPKDQTFRMWYQTHVWSENADDRSDCAIAYAESRDGLNWKRPELGLHEWKGTRANNIVSKGWGGKRASGPQVIQVPEKDRRGHRFIMTYRTGGVRDQSGVRVVGSQDGIHWEEKNDSLVMPLHSDTQNSIIYDDAVGEYVMFCRAKDRYLVGGRTDMLHDGESRRIASIQGKDLWSVWSGSPEMILVPDELDMERGFNRFYGLCAKRHAGITWGFLWPFKLNTDIVTELTWTHDGTHWQRFPTRPRLIELGKEGAWDDGMVFGSADWVEMGDEWWIYYAGSDGPHESRDRNAGIGLAKLRKEGFISMHGPRGGGVVCTKLIRWPGGPLFVNADASKGELRVQISDEKRKVLSGFSFEDGETFKGDSTTHEVKWKDKSLDELKGQAVRLEFFLKDADIYTFRAGP